MNEVMERKSNMLKNRKGFTLIELIVVIVIIGVLAAIVIPRLVGFQATARYKADVATAKTIATAAVTYMSENGFDTCALGDLTDFFDSGAAPTPQGGAAGAVFELDTADGGVSEVRNSDGDVVLYPDPADATPAGY